MRNISVCKPDVIAFIALISLRIQLLTIPSVWWEFM